MSCGMTDRLPSIISMAGRSAITGRLGEHLHPVFNRTARSQHDVIVGSKVPRDDLDENSVILPQLHRQAMCLTVSDDVDDPRGSTGMRGDAAGGDGQVL